MLADYAKYMTEFAQVMEDMEALETEDMTDEEAIYYTEVTLRISQKLMNVAQ